MDCYVFNGDIYCEDCGRQLKRVVRRRFEVEHGRRMAAADIEALDSTGWSDGPHPDGGGEADGPRHCGAGAGCCNAQDYGLPGLTVGVFLENDLTREGVRYVREAAAEDPASVAATLWLPTYARRRLLLACLLGGPDPNPKPEDANG